MVLVRLAPSGTAIIYRASEEIDAPSVLKAIIRQPGGTIGGSVIQIIHPDSPYIISSGFNPVTMTSSIKNISFRWSYGESGDIDAYSVMRTFSPAPSTWTADNFADVLNNVFRSEFPMNHFPIIAFSYKGEIGFAFDEPDGYLEIVAPTGNSAWTVLGFTAGDKAYSLGPRKFYIDGYEYSSIRA